MQTGLDITALPRRLSRERSAHPLNSRLLRKADNCGSFRRYIR
ncbi:hypothetical protein HMPREF1587_01275 [Bifidobacterium breve JCP7499]|nr:hypothetical protein HMPREF1587_01275 [Bifidobacterium breve JCP7499]